MKISTILINLGIILCMLGFFLLIFTSVFSKTESSGAFIIFIGPIPIGGMWGQYGPIILISLLIISILTIFLWLISLKNIIR